MSLWKKWMPRAGGKSAVRSVPGFSLIEIMVVLALIGLLVGTATVYFLGRLEAGKIDAARSQAYELEKALDLYYMQNGKYPTQAEGLEVLAKPTKGSKIMERLPKDPWGNEYIYTYPGVRNPEKFDVWSKGPDQIENTEDDVGNWPAN